MRFPRNARIFRGQLDAAPFASVFFLIAAFLLLSARLLFTPGVHIALPEVEADQPGTDDIPLVVGIDAAGRIYFENQITSETRLLARLRSVVASSRQPLTLVIQADRDGRLEVPMRLMAAARELGLKKVVFPTHRAGGTGSPGTTNAPAR